MTSLSRVHATLIEQDIIHSPVGSAPHSLLPVTYAVTDLSYHCRYEHSPIAFVIAGSEATGGAGIQVDLKTFQQLGVYGVGALSCIVAFDPNNSWGHRFHPVDPDIIAEQFEAALATHSVESMDTAKVGMLGTLRPSTPWPRSSPIAAGGTSWSTPC